jgi:hypothetical protein
MTDVIGFAAFLVLPLIGLAVWRLDEVRELALDGRIAVAGAIGALITAMVMSAMSIVHLEWSRTRLGVLLAIIVIAGMRKLVMPRVEASWPSPAIIFTCVLLAITIYGLLTARETIGDLLFFWGPKGIHFFRSGMIDVDYLRNPDHFLQHRDYPPLLPLLFAWSNSWSGSFSWWGALLLSALCFVGITSIIRAFSRDDPSALLAAAILAWVFARPWIGGGADPLLLVYEVLAVCALVFLRDAKAQMIVAGLALGAAAVTKIEGASFVVAVVLAMLLNRYPLKRIAAVLIPPIVLLGAWLTFIIRAELLDTYRGPGELSFQYLGAVMKQTLQLASYDAYWIPWIAPLAIVFLGDLRRARLPLTVAALSFGATIYFYLRSPSDPTVFWIPSSAHRVLLTPLMMLVVAAAAAHAKEKLPAAHEARRGAKGQATESDHGQVANAPVSVIALNG